MNKFLFGKANRKVEFIARLGIMIALTVAFQYVSGLAQIQLLTGSVVNMFLLLSVIATGLIGGVVVSLVTPFIGFWLGLAKNITLIPFIAVSNIIFVVLFVLLIKLFKVSFDNKLSDFKNTALIVISFVLAAVAKFLFLYLIALKLFLPLIMGNVPQPIVITFGVTQLFTALIGGALATMIAYPLNRANVL